MVSSDPPIDASGSTVPTEQQTPVGIEDSTGTQIDPLTAVDISDEAFENGTALASGGTITNSVAAKDVTTLAGRVVRASTSYNVVVDWKDAAGNVLFSDTVASGVTAGTETSLNETAISPYCDVTIEDAGSASGAVTATIFLR